MSLHQRLKDETNEIHKWAEAQLDLEIRLTSKEKFLNFLYLQERLFRTVEHTLKKTWGQHPFYTERNGFEDRHLAMSKDLEALAEGFLFQDQLESRGDFIKDESLPNSLEELHGFLYVIEGSTMGGQIIGRRAAERLGIAKENLSAFFMFDMERWRWILKLVNDSSDYQALKAGALKAFQLFGDYYRKN